MKLEGVGGGDTFDGGFTLCVRGKFIRLFVRSPGLWTEITDLRKVNDSSRDVCSRKLEVCKDGRESLL